MWQYKRNQNELYHYGILGMRWGHRKSSNNTQASRKNKNRIKQRDRAIKKSRKQDLKKIRALTDNDIQKKIKRLQLERELKYLTKDDLMTGRSAVMDILKGSGKKIASSVLTGVGLYAIKTAISGEFNIKEAANYIAPKPKNK